MAPGVMETAHLDYLREHLRILSGFYGPLRPFDGMTPYRLEMKAKLSADGCRDLYQFWGNRKFHLTGVKQYEKTDFDCSGRRPSQGQHSPACGGVYPRS